LPASVEVLFATTGRPTFRLPGHDGVGIDAGVVASWLTRERDGLRSSMLEDQLAGRPLELDANRRADLRALGVSGAPITAAALQEILTLHDARSSLAPGGNCLSERPSPPAGEGAGGVAVDSCAVPPSGTRIAR
jgi:hypothetical protein